MDTTKSKAKYESVNSEAIALLAAYLDKIASKSEKQKWDEFCCSGRWAKVFIAKQESSFLAKKTIGAACAKVFSQVSTGKEPPIVTAANVKSVREAAKKLRRLIQDHLHFPPQSMTSSFKRGLDSLVALHHSDCITLTSQRGKLWRRWCVYELARELLRGFDKAPDNLIVDLLSLLWDEPVDDAWVRSILGAEILGRLRNEISQQLAYETADRIASIHAEGIINSMKRVCSPEAKESAEILMDQVNRLLSGKPRFDNDASAEQAAIDAIGCMSDLSRAQATIAEIKRMDADY